MSARSIYTRIRPQPVQITSTLQPDLIRAVMCYFEVMPDARSRNALHLAIIALSGGHTVSLAQCLDAMPAHRQRPRRGLRLVASNPEASGQNVQLPTALRIVARTTPVSEPAAIAASVPTSNEPEAA